MFIFLGNTPTLPNLDQTVTFADSTAANTLMYTVSSSDNDPLDTLTVSMTTTTSSFSFDAVSGKVLLLTFPTEPSLLTNIAIKSYNLIKSFIPSSHYKKKKENS